VKWKGLVKRKASFPAGTRCQAPFWNEFANMMSIVRFYASILRIVEICLDIGAISGKYIPREDSEKSAGFEAGWSLLAKAQF
jgi:hypothetical protein